MGCAAAGAGADGWCCCMRGVQGRKPRRSHKTQPAAVNNAPASLTAQYLHLHPSGCPAAHRPSHPPEARNRRVPLLSREWSGREGMLKPCLSPMRKASMSTPCSAGSGAGRARPAPTFFKIRNHLPCHTYPGHSPPAHPPTHLRQCGHIHEGVEEGEGKASVALVRVPLHTNRHDGHAQGPRNSVGA